MSEIYPQFISNSPIGEDLFEGKSQEKVAHYICENLLKNDRCKIVGIDGGWGTGKSNLIEITKKKLNETTNGKYHFFVYDAWGHQEDLQRRSILEELTSFLTFKTNGISIISDATKWENKLKTLLAKSKETQKKTIPSLSFGVIFSGLLLLIMPLFKALSEQVTCKWLKVLIVAVPLILLILLFGYYYFKRTDKLQNYKFRLSQAVQKLFYIYQKSQQSDTTFETISEDEPSVKKFRDWMHKIAEDLGENRLIVVFDNMDRLPDNKITELWSSIHTFFAEEKYECIKVIIPFDRQNIKNAFKHTSEDNISYTDDFVNKTFDIVYRVSPPILSDWKKFFENKWLQAFNSNDDEFQKVLQIFDHLATCKTPRDMVVFINECVSNNQINPNIPFRYIALFVLSKSVLLKNTEQEIIQPSYLKSLDFLYLEDTDLPKFIAALSYQIDPNRALEVVFTDRLKNGLNSFNKTQVDLISASTVFPILLDRAIMVVDNLSNTTLALNDLGDKVTVKIWNDLYYRLGLPIGHLLDSKTLPYQLILLAKVTDKASYLKNLIILLVSAVKFVSTDYYNSLKEIEKIIKENNLKIKLADYLIEKKVTASEFVALLKIVKDNDTYKLYCDNTELNGYLEGLDKPEEWQNSSYLRHIPESYKMTKFIEMLTAKITEHSNDSETLRPYIVAYKNISKTQLKQVLTDDAIHSLFVEEGDVDEFYYDLIRMRIARWEKFQETYASDFEEILADESKVTVEEVAKEIHKFVDYGDMLLKLPSFNKPLIKAVAKDITINRRTTRTLSLVNTLNKIDEIINALDIDPKIMADQLNCWNCEDITQTHIGKILLNTNFFVFASSYENALTKHLNKLALEYYQQLSYEQWLVELKKIDSKLVLSSLVVLKNQYPPNATSAIKEVLEGIANGDIPVPEYDLWVKIIDKLNKNTLRATMKDVRDIYVLNKEIQVSSFIFFGDWLFEYGELTANSAVLRRIFRKSLLQTSTIELIMRHSEKMKRIYENSTDKEDFANEIKVLLSEKNADFQDFASLLEISINEEKGKTSE